MIVSGGLATTYLASSYCAGASVGYGSADINAPAHASLSDAPLAIAYLDDAPRTVADVDDYALAGSQVQDS